MTRATSPRKAEEYLRSTGIGDTAFFGPEAEFYIFDSARFETAPNAGFYYIDSIEGAWNTGLEDAAATSGTSPRTRAATSRSRRPTTTPTCARR